MSRAANVSWAAGTIDPKWIEGKRVIDVGSRDWTSENQYEINIHEWIKDKKPAEYIGIDIKPGPNVDYVIDGKYAFGHFSDKPFDLVLCLEVLEHEQEWQLLIDSLKQLTAPGGHLILTTRLPGYEFHGFPHDYWRFTGEILKEAFSDFSDVAVVEDREDFGVYISCRRPHSGETPKDISAIQAIEVRP